ncbi:MAG: ExeM/NucH family extracellular endonuclease, partial [Synechococcaceae bacterium WB9_4xB_025]|nr:ExeM/NucH family extracellular endonuclease [Synechococcaceae bacterium WB9_4xB_025]
WVVLPKDAFLEGTSEATPGRHAVSTLFFSEYAEGSSNNKYLEIYNPTNEAITLDEYAFPNASNGAEGNYEFWNTFPAGATIQAGGTYLIAHPEADASILALADQTHQYLSNGDDGYALVKGTENNYVIVDRIGDFGADPGSGWEVAGISNATQNHTLVRKSSVFSGNADWDASRGTNTTDSEWEVLDNDAFLNANPQATPGSFSSTAETPIVLPSESSEEEPVITTNTFISTIQGSGIASELVGEQHRIEGIVTAIHPAMKGFYVQEEAADSDNDASTSEGLFIYDPNGLFNGAIGDLIQVTGTVSEYTTNAANFTSSSNEVQNSLTQLSSITDVSILSSGNSLPATSELTLPVADIAAMEALEGMRVSVNAGQNPLTVTNNYTTGRFGQVGLSAQGRLYQYTEQNAPDVDGYSAYLSELEKAVIWLDDASTAGNPATVIHARGGEPLSASNTLRTGDTIESISGVVDQRFEGYRVQSTAPADFQPANERTLTAPARQGSVRVAAFNLLNFWNGDGAGSGFPTERGALSLEQYDQQLTKLLAALQGLNADIVALQELENDGFGPTSAIASLVDALNGEAGANVYDYVRVPDAALTEGRLGTDAIANGLIYRTDKVRLATDTEIASLDLGYTRVGDDPATQSANRPVIAASFEDLSSGETFTTVSAHLKSKGSEAQGEGNADINDGQGFSNGQRSREAQAIADWLKTDPTGSGDPDVLILGDFNAYSMEDPLTLLKAEGYSDLATTENYTYQFRGQFGALDHAMASDTFLSSVVNASPWHINSDEPVALVHTNYQYSPDLTVGSDSIEPYYAPDAYASSDHDPIVVDLFATGSELFSHGVASGDPYADSVILWTRYTAEAMPFASLTSKEIAWEVSTSKDFATLVDSGTFSTSAERDWTVKVEADGLEAGTAYYYRFNADGVYSEIGETNTLSVDANQVRLAVLSCANFTNTPAFDTYSRVAGVDAKRPFDAALFLGDYIYEYGVGGYAAAESAADQRGFSPDREIITLDDYRQRYGQYHTDAGLREMRASLPLIAIWDDHETANDSFKTGAENHDPDQGEGDWSDRVNAAMQAYYEWMP